MGVEPQHPVSDNLEADPADLGRFAPRAAIVNRRQSKKPARLRAIFRALGDRPKSNRVKIIPKPNRRRHDEHPCVRQVESNFYRFGNPPRESASARLGIRAFDALVKKISSEPQSSALRIELAFLAGYLTTVAAGGAASLGLASNVAHSAPEISGWAYLIGGLGERVTWSGGFSGLGRIVARELMRAFRLDVPPSADFAADEAHVLVDKQLTVPLVHLQVKQNRIVTAALFPGVNLQVPLAEQPPEPRRQTDDKRVNQPVASPHISAAEEAFQVIANMLAPMILDRIRGQLPATSRERNSKGKWPKGSQRKLPLAGDE